MMIVIERSLDEPVYEQIARQIRECVASGELSPGTPLPTVRVLASDLGVNLNTVARAYWLLEEEGFIRIRDRSGAQVAAPVRRPAGDRERLRQELRETLARLHQAGLTSEDLHRLVEREIASLADIRNK
jgi:DNA-binding transcriptional regulator YhcF (GntR family)